MGIATKKYDVLLYGSDARLRLVEKRLHDTKLKLFVVDTHDTFRFTGKGTASVNGELISFQRALLCPQFEHLPAPPDIAVVKAPSAGTTYVAGGQALGIMKTLEHLYTGQRIMLIEPDTELLKEYDSAVKDVVLRLLTRRRVSVTVNARVTAARHTEAGYVIEILQSDKTHTMACNGFVWADETVVPKDIGLANITNRDDNPSYATETIYYPTPSIGIIPASMSLCLADIEQIAAFLLKGRRTTLHGLNKAVARSEHGFVMFSYGIREQEISSSLVAYKKSTVRIAPHAEHLPTQFMKVITSMRGKVIGASGFMRATHFDEQLFDYLIRYSKRLPEINEIISADNPLASSYVALVRSLH